MPTLKQYMDTKGLTCKTMGDQIGVTDATVSRLCNGKQNASRKLLRKVVIATKGEFSADDALDIPLKFRGK